MIYEIAKALKGRARFSCIECCVYRKCKHDKDANFCDNAHLKKGEYLQRVVGTDKHTKDILLKAFRIFYTNNLYSPFDVDDSDFEEVLEDIFRHWEDDIEKI